MAFSLQYSSYNIYVNALGISCDRIIHGNESMKLTKSKTVRDIVRPPVIGMPAHPSVEMSDLIVQAVELMLKNNAAVIAVSARGRLIGHIRLSDALERLGIRMPDSRSEAKTKFEYRKSKQE